MKKILLVLIAGLIAAAAYSQPQLNPWQKPWENQAGDAELPFSKLLGMSNYALNDAGFSYNPNKNRYLLRKGDFWGTMDARPMYKNYRIIVQYGKTGIAFVRVEFTNPEIYHEIMEHLIRNNIRYQETVSDGEVRVTFSEGDRIGTLTRTPKHRAVTYTNEDGTYSVTRDLSHENFTYVLSTGKEPSSIWHDKQKKKREKREKKGRKAVTPIDFM